MQPLIRRLIKRLYTSQPDLVLGVLTAPVLQKGIIAPGTPFGKATTKTAERKSPDAIQGSCEKGEVGIFQLTSFSLRVTRLACNSFVSDLELTTRGQKAIIAQNLTDSSPLFEQVNIKGGLRI